MPFSTESTVRLIDLYRKNDVLWKISHKNYRRVEIKNYALQQIADEIKVNVEDVKKKIRNLRNTYVQHKKLKEKRKKSGSAVDDNNKTWFLFNEMKFLDEVVVLRKSTGNYETTETENIAVEYEEAGETTDCDEYGESSMASKTFTKKSLKKQSKYDVAIAELCSSASSKPQTIFDTFSATVALQLEEIYKLNIAEAFSIMQVIQNVIGNKISELMENKSTSQTCHHYENKKKIISTSPSDFEESVDLKLSSDTMLSGLTSNSISSQTFKPSATKTKSSTITQSTPIDFTKQRRPYYTSYSPEICEFSPRPETSNSTLNSTISATTPIPKTSTSFKMFKSSSPPPLQPISASKKAKVLDDVMVKYKYNTSCLLNDAIMADGITDADKNSKFKFALDDVLIQY